MLWLKVKIYLIKENYLMKIFPFLGDKNLLFGWNMSFLTYFLEETLWLYLVKAFKISFLVDCKTKMYANVIRIKFK